ncbi:Uncharacterized conserved protein YbbK, DUF523 family [Desulfonatronum thiosulfatophilum]|uniref:Uncharacterized conserved protein YbbK, DUF523 family n=1 Tax=Desulfonatronum thiosulfatophilum TaxID=617002 RepID=A0A1G6CIS6_9BACT|nr:DUF523 and DUF1722 domain-containing protein [Desulfonatronum thiosulfatophilum]SDB32803.1 Uncharacterized conserved protein YbbK, DUF523 family [Desulfonatronum thiosulfatophilum]
MNSTLDRPLRLGISSCLMGNNVRYDGGHKLDRFLRDTLGKYVEFVPVCPEVECGMPVPREAMRLVGEIDNPRLVTIRSGHDFTDQMQAWAAEKNAWLAQQDLCGFIFKSKSPSSGMQGVKVYSEKGMPKQAGVGIFAQTFIQRFPLLPVEDDGRLHDPGLRENFIERIFVMRRWQDVEAFKPALAPLIAFHSRHKYLILSHSTKHYQSMGALVAHASEMEREEVFAEYARQLAEALQLRTTKAKLFNVLEKCMGYFKKQLTAWEKQELLEVFRNFKEGRIPLIVPIVLLNHYIRKFDEPYLKDQYFFDPHPLELKLRNHV